MKKLVKILGLLLVAGALFVGCKQEANIETDEIKLSNGTWDLEMRAAYSVTQSTFSASFASGENITFKVEGETYTVTKGSYNYSVTYDFGSEAAASAAKAQLESYYKAEDGFSVSTSGSKITVKSSQALDDEDIASMNKGDCNVSEFSAMFPEDAVIKTNKKKTEYKITYTEKADPDDEDDYDVNYTVTIKKQK